MRTVALTLSLLSLAACVAPPTPPAEPLAEDPRLTCARAVAHGGAPSDTPHLDALARQTAELTPELGLDELLDGAAPASDGLRPGDEVLLDVAGHPELSGTRRVAPDGHVDAPPLGRVRAAGRTCGELAERVARTLGETYLQDRPRVDVTITTRAAGTVQVVGRVGAHVAPAPDAAAAPPARDRPWVSQVELPADRGLDLYGLLIRVGGPASDADVERLALVRRPAAWPDAERGPRAPSTRCHHFTWSALVAAHLQGRDVWLQPDDQVVVPRLPIVHVFGAVPAPGPYALEAGDTVAALVLRAGGLAAPGASPLVILDGEGERPARLDTPLRGGQVVWVAAHGEVHVVGAGVSRSGPVPIPSTGLSVVQAIAQAGWFTQFASPDRVEVLRDSGRTRLRVPVSRILAGEVSDRSYLLRAGDTVVVPEGLW